MSEPDGVAAVAVVLTTLATVEQAEALARQLVEERLIACGNLVPGLTSLYRWDGAVACEAEVLLMMKTPTARVEQLFERVAQLHPYELPELVALPVDAVSAAYGRWVQNETNQGIA